MNLGEIDPNTNPVAAEIAKTRDTIRPILLEAAKQHALAMPGFTPAILDMLIKTDEWQDTLQQVEVGAVMVAITAYLETEAARRKAWEHSVEERLASARAAGDHE